MWILTNIFVGEMLRPSKGLAELVGGQTRSPPRTQRVFQWDVDFKLHVPSNTTVEGGLRDGTLPSLKVTPQSRAADVVNMLAK